MMPLDDMYIEWLYEQVGSLRTRDKTRTYWVLFRQLYSTEFVWFVPNDDNRVEDGRNLRYEFVDAARLPKADAAWMGMGCSVLEMLIALSRRLAFDTSTRARDWFWALMDNLDLRYYNDSRHQQEAVEERVNILVFRQYNPDGTGGGLFPLHYPQEDQRNVEIWYQMAAYLSERM